LRARAPSLPYRLATQSASIASIRATEFDPPQAGGAPGERQLADPDGCGEDASKNAVARHNGTAPLPAWRRLSDIVHRALLAAAQTDTTACLAEAA
jgi:hypothetical protein